MSDRTYLCCIFLFETAAHLQTPRFHQGCGEAPSFQIIKGKVENLERYVCTPDLKISTDVRRQTALSIFGLFASITMHPCFRTLVGFMIIPSTKNHFYFQLSRIYAFLIFLIGSERAESRNHEEISDNHRRGGRKNT